MRSLFTALPFLLVLSACGDKDTLDEETPDGGADCTADSDGDGLDDCAEAELGTDASVADSDGDGLSDGEEADCVSDPLDADEQCYACGWRHADPGNIEPTGARIGDVVENLPFTDQCGEAVDLHDFADQYSILFMTAAWCGACLQEARELSSWQADFASGYDVPMGYVVVLFESRTGALPDGDEAVFYDGAMNNPGDVPVLSDEAAAILDATPYAGTTLPGRCVLSPQMEILDCKTGHGNDTELYTLILEDAQ